MKVFINKHINAPVEQVFAVFSDLEHAEDNIEAIKKFEIITDGSIGIGTRFRETRIMFKREATEEMEITEWDPPKRYVVEAHSCGCHYISTFDFHEEDGGTRVELTFSSEPLRFAAKIMSFLLGWMMISSIRKLFAKDIEDLTAVIEGRTGSATQPA